MLLFILLACAGFFFFRARRRRSLVRQHLSAGGRSSGGLPLARRDPLDGSYDEREPLDRPWTTTPAGRGRYSPTHAHRSTFSTSSSAAGSGGGGRPGSPRYVSAGGKGRTVLDEEAAAVVFDLGDDDESDGEPAKVGGGRS